MTFKNVYKYNNIIKFQEQIQNLKYLLLVRQKGQENILNNLLTNLLIIKFTNIDAGIEINNLPINLKEIYFERGADIQLKKITFWMWRSCINGRRC